MASATAPKCSFCGKSQRQVCELLAGPSALICDECIQLGCQLINQRHPRLMQRKLHGELEDAQDASAAE